MKVRTGLMSGDGLGNTAEDIIHLTGLDRLTTLYSQITGKECGCKQRKDKLNKIFPYPTKTT
jgi:hypothetical protein